MQERKSFGEQLEVRTCMVKASPCMKAMRRARGPKRPLFLSCEREIWLGRTQGLEEIRVVRFLPRRVAYRKWKQPKGRWNHIFFFFFDQEHRATGFGICPPGF